MKTTNRMRTDRGNVLGELLGAKFFSVDVAASLAFVLLTREVTQRRSAHPLMYRMTIDGDNPV